MIVVQSGMRVELVCALEGRRVGTVEDVTVLVAAPGRPEVVVVRVLLDEPLGGGIHRLTVGADDVTPILV